VDLLMALGISLVAGAFIVGFLRGWQRTTDARRRENERATYERRKGAEEIGRLVEDLTRCFPHAREALRAELGHGRDPKEAVRKALESVPGVLLGETTIVIAGRPVSVPVRWPASARRKAGYIVGRTGSGKTTLLSLCVKADIDAGHGAGVIAPEHELFAEVLLPLCERRAREVLYFAPGDPSCPIHLNPLSVEPGDDPSRCAGEVYEILRRAIGRNGFGARMGPTLANGLAVLVDRPGTTLWDIRRLLEDDHFRENVLASATDPYALNFWRTVYPTYPRGSATPLANRLDETLRSPALRRALSQPDGFSMRDVLAKGRILLVDLGRLDPQSMAIIGQVVVSRLQLELLRREVQSSAERRTFYLYCDEFQTFTAAEAGWREALSRGRRYGLALAVGHQHCSQIPRAVLDEILGNVGTILAFSIGAKDGDLIRKELLYNAGQDQGLKPVPLEALVHQPVGSALARFGSSACAIRLRVTPPIKTLPREVGERVREASWQKFGCVSVESEIDPVAGPIDPRTDNALPVFAAVGVLSDIELRFVKAVVENPGRPSAEYAKLLGLNGTRAARLRKTLVERGLLREYKLARNARGKPAVILEPLQPACQALAAVKGTCS